MDIDCDFLHHNWFSLPDIFQKAHLSKSCQNFGIFKVLINFYGTPVAAAADHITTPASTVRACRPSFWPQWGYITVSVIKRCRNQAAELRQTLAPELPERLISPDRCLCFRVMSYVKFTSVRERARLRDWTERFKWVCTTLIKAQISENVCKVSSTNCFWVLFRDSKEIWLNINNLYYISVLRSSSDTSTPDSNQSETWLPCFYHLQSPNPCYRKI